MKWNRRYNWFWLAPKPRRELFLIVSKDALINQLKLITSKEKIRRNTDTVKFYLCLCSPLWKILWSVSISMNDLLRSTQGDNKNTHLQKIFLKLFENRPYFKLLPDADIQPTHWYVNHSNKNCFKFDLIDNLSKRYIKDFFHAIHPNYVFASKWSKSKNFDLRWDLNPRPLVKDT